MRLSHYRGARVYLEYRSVTWDQDYAADVAELLLGVQGEDTSVQSGELTIGLIGRFVQFLMGDRFMKTDPRNALRSLSKVGTQGHTQELQRPGFPDRRS